VIYIALVRLGVVPDPGVAIRERHVARIAGIFIVTLAVGMAVGGFYENVEWLEDKWDILGGHFVKGLWDTETDLLCDAAGSIAGATFITILALRGRASHPVPALPAPGRRGGGSRGSRGAPGARGPAVRPRPPAGGGSACRSCRSPRRGSSESRPGCCCSHCRPRRSGRSGSSSARRSSSRRRSARSSC